MRRRLLPALFALPLLFLPARVEAVTLEEIVALTKAGLGDEVLVALIEIDRRVFPIDPATLSKLKKEGVSERVLVAIVKSGRTPPPPSEVRPAPVVTPDPAETPAPQVVVIDHEPAVREVVVPVAVPVYVGTGSRSRGRHNAPHAVKTEQPVGLVVPPSDVFVSGTIRNVQPRAKKPEPVYWGWGGKLRPDAWKPSPDKK